MEGLSDAGSIPARSTNKAVLQMQHGLFCIFRNAGAFLKILLIH